MGRKTKMPKGLTLEQLKNDPMALELGSTGRRGLEADGTLAFLKKAGIPVNRANYLGVRFMDPKITPETDLGGEIEMDIPEALRHPNHS